MDILDSRTSIFSKVEKGIDQILAMAQQDITNLLMGNLTLWAQTYDNVLDSHRETTYSVIQSDFKMATQVHGILKGRVLSTEELLPLLRMFKRHKRLLETKQFFLSDTRFSFVGRVPVELVSEHYSRIPFYLMRNRQQLNDSENCLSSKDTSHLINLYSWLIPKLEELLASNGESKNFNMTIDEDRITVNGHMDTNISDSLLYLLKLLHHHKSKVGLCLGFLVEYRNQLDDITNWVKSISFPRFTFSDSLDLVETVRIILNSRTWIYELFEDYANGELDWLQLAVEFGEEKNRVHGQMEGLRLKVRQSVSIPLVDAISSSEKFLIDLYTEILEQMTKLVAYFDEVAKDVVHSFSLWYIPYVNIGSPDVLVYKLSGDEGRSLIWR